MQYTCNLILANRSSCAEFQVSVRVLCFLYQLRCFYLISASLLCCKYQLQSCVYKYQLVRCVEAKKLVNTYNPTYCYIQHQQPLVLLQGNILVTTFNPGCCRIKQGRKDIVQQDLRGVESGLKRYSLINYFVTLVYFFKLKGHPFERSYKPVSAS